MRVGLSYTGGTLDRASDRRKDPAWVADQLARPQARIVPVWRSRNLVAGIEAAPAAASAVLCRLTEAAELLAAAAEFVFLGLDEGAAVFAADLSAHAEADALALTGEGAFVDLRQAGPWLGQAEGALLAYARGLLQWHRSHRHCGRCGTATEICDGGHRRLCPACSQQSFPRTDPAVIMLVAERPVSGPQRCLLGHHGRLPPGAFSTLAGFVEPGESLEEAVAREVFEETGVTVGRVAYQASQPWPFPASIMLGFRAEAVTTAITLHDEELSEARWFTAAEVRKLGEWGEAGAALKIPRRDSIARHLIETWLAEAGG